MTVYSAEPQLVAGLWAWAEAETGDQVVSLRVNVAPGEGEELASEDVDASLAAQGQDLGQTYGVNDRPLTYVSTGSVTQVAFFGFANPDNLVPDSANIRVRGETVAFGFAEGTEPDVELPMV